MGVATNEMVEKLGVPWTFRILGFMLWAVCLPAACIIRQPVSAKTSVPKLQWWDYVLKLVPPITNKLQGTASRNPISLYYFLERHWAVSLCSSRLISSLFLPVQLANQQIPPSLPSRSGIWHPLSVASLPDTLPIHFWALSTASWCHWCSVVSVLSWFGRFLPAWAFWQSLP